MAEAISRFSIRRTTAINGKRLRLRQQYLLVSSSLQSILNEHLKTITIRLITFGLTRSLCTSTIHTRHSCPNLCGCC